MTATANQSPEASTIQRLGVIGAGQMGGGIAQVAAQRGLHVELCDISLEVAQKGKAKLAAGLAKLVEKGKLTAEARDEALSRITVHGDYAALAGCDFAIEAATENQELKKKIFAEMDRHLAPGAILATNTSSISITLLAAVTRRPEQVIGMHFMNPVPVMSLVEIIRGLQTSDATHDAVKALAEALGKSPITVKNAPGFVVNRILVPMINEAFFVLAEGLATPEDIDAGMKLGCNHPMGPLTLSDFVGLDTTYYIANIMFEEFKDRRFAPPPLLKRMVQAGLFGRKSGRGFYDYSDPKNLFYSEMCQQNSQISSFDNLSSHFLPILCLLPLYRPFLFATFVLLILM